MAGNVYLWETTAANNDDADGDVNWSEGQLPGTINSSARGMMAAVAGWLKDINGTLATGGSSSAYTVTSNTAYPALATGIMLGVKANHSSTGTSTLTLNALTTKYIIKCTQATAELHIVANNMKATGNYMLRYDADALGAAGAWILLNPTIE